MEHPPLTPQLAFLLEADRLKEVLRQNPIASAARRENSAEHSWHLALMAGVLARHAAEPADLLRVLPMLLIHDLVEIDAGDTFAYDEAANVTRAEREERAAERIFGMLPPGQATEFRALWDEFEAGRTPESRQRPGPAAAAAAQRGQRRRHLAGPRHPPGAGAQAHGPHPHRPAQPLARGPGDRGLGLRGRAHSLARPRPGRCRPAAC